jgi:hypothetical protein
MPMEYTIADQKLAENAYIRFSSTRERGAILQLELQFPPKILTDNRKADWDEAMLFGVEPIATIQSTGAREISLQVTYIVDGGVWTTQTVAEEVRKIRGYFSRLRDGLDNRNLVVSFNMWLHGGGDEAAMSCRIKGVSVKHSETQVFPRTPGNGAPNQWRAAYPLRTDVTIDLRLY